MVPLYRMHPPRLDMITILAMGLRPPTPSLNVAPSPTMDFSPYPPSLCVGSYGCGPMTKCSYEEKGLSHVEFLMAYPKAGSQDAVFLHVSEYLVSSRVSESISIRRSGEKCLVYCLSV